MANRNRPLKSPIKNFPTSGPSTGYGKGVHDYLHQYIAIADAKAAAFLAGDLAGIALAVDQNSITLYGKIAYLITLGLLMLAAILSAIVLFPRLPRGQKGTIFWEHILRYKDKKEYLDALRNLDDREIELEYAEQNYMVSKVLHSKHVLIRWSIILSLAALFMLAITHVIE